ncbi:hypothetical protein D0Y65_037975 [Glycine soja]|uniref:Uncharacterized protein n=1 Tax=Glycine soja TaxID=3848 RepID=A0A445H2T9_GLYSO|nr:hypothetical protein D0Y65_037975 [Glycine soja]
MTSFWSWRFSKTTVLETRFNIVTNAQLSLHSKLACCDGICECENSSCIKERWGSDSFLFQQEHKRPSSDFQPKRIN